MSVYTYNKQKPQKILALWPVSLLYRREYRPTIPFLGGESLAGTKAITDGGVRGSRGRGFAGMHL